MHTHRAQSDKSSISFELRFSFDAFSQNPLCHMIFISILGYHILFMDTLENPIQFSEKKIYTTSTEALKTLWTQTKQIREKSNLSSAYQQDLFRIEILMWLMQIDFG